MPGRSGRIGAVRSSACTWDFSSMHTTTAFSGGLRYRPTTSRTLASSSGSVENLKVSTRHGCSFHLRQIRATVAKEMPSCAASSRLDQCVTPSSGGGGCKVVTTTVARIWRKWKLQPWRVETFKFSTDPELDAKVRDVVALYPTPPEKAVVVCIDEKSQVQALDRT